MAVFNYKCELLLKHLPSLQCHKCKNIPGPNRTNRYFCIKESHALCELHRFRCLCGSLVGEKPSPAIGKLLQDLPWMCQNYSKGCREIKTDVEELEHHQVKCIFRQVYCPAVSCDSRPLFKNVIDHLIFHHSNKVCCEMTDYNKACQIEKSLGFLKYCIPSKITNKDGYVFYEASYFLDNTYHFWIYLLGSTSEARNLTCSYSVKNSELKLDYTGPVHSLDKSRDEIITSGLCFTMTENTVKRYMNEKKTFNVWITIRNLKEEAKDNNVESGISDDE